MDESGEGGEVAVAEVPAVELCCCADGGEPVDVVASGEACLGEVVVVEVALGEVSVGELDRGELVADELDLGGVVDDADVERCDEVLD